MEAFTYIIEGDTLSKCLPKLFQSLYFKFSALHGTHEKLQFQITIMECHARLKIWGRKSLERGSGENLSSERFPPINTHKTSV